MAEGLALIAKLGRYLEDCNKFEQNLSYWLIWISSSYLPTKVGIQASPKGDAGPT